MPFHRPSSDPSLLPARSVQLLISLSGGLEILFDNVSKHSISLPRTSSNGNPTTVGDLVGWIVTNLIKDPRTELFMLDGAM